jgi:DNA-binding NtrC family response regulator
MEFTNPDATMSDAQRPLKDLVADYERQLITEALAATGGNQRRAAAALGVLPTTLHEKLKRLGLYMPRLA